MSKLPVNDVEARAFKALVAFKVEAGMDKTSAEAWAQTRAAAGAVVWKQAFDKTRDFDEGAMLAANAALKTWARAQ